VELIEGQNFSWNLAVAEVAESWSGTFFTILTRDNVALFCVSGAELTLTALFQIRVGATNALCK
jgi:hypothetical protein